MKPVMLKFAMLCMVLLATSVGSNLMSQTTLGVKGGYTAATLRGDDAGNVDWHSGFAGGLFVNVAVLKFFTVQPELLFRQRGGENNNETFNINQKLNLTYMDLPVLFKLRVPIAKTFYPHVYAGPQFSYNIKGDYKVSAGAVSAEDPVEVRKVDFGGVMGFGLDVVVKRLFLTADFRYGLGAINIDDSDEPFLLKNKDLSILLGIGVNFGGK